MPLDTRSIGEAMRTWPQPPDVLGAVQGGMARAYQLQGMQQAQQVRQLQLEEAQRQEFERQNLGQAIRGTMTTDPVTGQRRPNLTAGLAQAYTTSRDPLALFKVEQDYTKSQADSRKTALEAHKLRLEGLQKQSEYVSGLANGVLAAVEQGADPEAAYQRAIQEATAVLGPEMIQGLPPTFDRGVVTQFAMKGLTSSEALKAKLEGVNQALRQEDQALQRRGQDITVRGQDLTAQTQQRGQDIQREDIRERQADRQQTRTTQADARTFEQEDKLRNDFIAQTKPYQTQSDFYGRIETAAQDPSAAGDLTLIYSFMKLLDPGSTVLAGEYATAANAGSIPERIYSQYNRLVSGELLGDEERGTIRKDYIDRARRLYDQATKDYQRTKTVFEDRARRYNLNPANVTQDLGTTAPREAPGAGGAQAAPAVRVLTEQDITDTIAASETAGRPVTRQQVIDAARNKGYQVP